MSAQDSRAPLLTGRLRAATGDATPSLTSTVIPALLRGISRTGTALRRAHSVTKAGSANVFGDAQLNVDVQAEQFFREAIAACPAIVAASSEEDPVEQQASTSPGDGDDNDDVYAVAFDPLDGSSIIASNWAVGSILGIWSGRTALRQDPRRQQVAAVLAVYGPRTTAVIAVRVPGREADAVCLEVAVDDEVGACEIIADLSLRNAEPATRYFAPANLRAAAEDPRYMALVTRYIAERYTLRYSGGLVPDVVHALVKGHGVYVSPVTPGSRAKLRRAFEVLPVALVVECAGGEAVDPVDGGRVLDTPLRDLDETAGLVCGTAGEVERVKVALLGEGSGN
ncbi:sedoheptulose-1,7-bisphosphatase [Xylaria cf. heliscus]|nr:sedoheptulose-1,7-bisphosphatase [Xylaria cf. heliscus]